MTEELLPPNAHVGIVMLSAIGDAVHVLPVVRAIKRARPDVRVTWVIQPLPWQLVRDHPDVDRFVLFHRRRGLRGLGPYLETLRELRAQPFDLLIGLQVYLKAGLLTAGARARVKLGFDRARARDFNWLFTTHRIPAAPPGHVQDQYLEFVRHLGIDPEPVEWGLQLSPEERLAQARFYENLPRPVCAVVLGTSKPQKNWSAARYARLLEALEQDFGFRTMLVGGTSEAEERVARHLRQRCRCRPIDARENDLRRLVWLIDGADLLITPDTGPLHIARALDTPVVSLFGYTNPKRVGPYRKYTDLIVDGYARWPGEDYPLSMEYRPGGMQRVSVQAVLEAVERALHRYVAPPAGAGDALNRPQAR